MTDFPLHWLRPELWWTAIPLLLGVWLLARQQLQQRQWHRLIDPELLPWLLDGDAGKPRRGFIGTSGVAALLCWLALLGPSWQQLPAKLQRNSDALAIVLDLSPSMLAEDVQPSRLRQAGFKIRDLLALRRDGQTALVASAGDAFVVAPLTDDSNTLMTLLPALHPDMMPVPGSNPLAGLQQAEKLLQQGGRGEQGRILFIGDSFDDSQWPALKKFASHSPFPISVLAVGTTDGAPIPLAEGGFARGDNGNIIIPHLDRRALQKLADAGGGLYRELQLDNSDIAPLADHSRSDDDSEGEGGSAQRHYEQWRDGGPWLVLLLLPLCLSAFRRSVIPALLLAPLLTHSPASQALEWRNLWQTPDQQGARLFEQQPAEAAKHFRNPGWRGSALFRAGDYDAAAAAYAEDDSADGHYNRGNALARAGKLDEALQAYDNALQRQPGMADAAANKKLIEELQKQQQQQQTPQNDDTGQSGQDSQPQDDKNPQHNQQAGENAQDREDQSGDSQQDREQNPDPSQSGQQQSGQQRDDSQDTDDAGDSRQQDDDDPKKSAAQQQAEKSAARDYAQQTDQQQSEPSSDNAQAAPEPPGNQATGQPENVATAAKMSEEQQAQEQWLRQIPESADGLLRNKFYYQARQRQQRGELPESSEIAPY